jgi:hypothetical protein
MIERKKKGLYPSSPGVKNVTQFTGKTKVQDETKRQDKTRLHKTRLDF